VRYSILSEATFVYGEKMDKKEFRELMKHCFLAKKKFFEAKAWLDILYLGSAPAKSTVEKSFAKLKRSKICIGGDARRRRPKEAVSDKNIKKSTT
jgi:hypothetical protein